ncbi:DUF4190 domain-containing protein [Nocardioides sp. J54]|uniref:DUF4190 domain-containing protein n=1 Tax=Nocardioides sp. J54 TaxID=935866 RepID=UPI0004AE9D0A|nr:DUF4190 domain-containing protein [Nocardioides sp. J54]
MSYNQPPGPGAPPPPPPGGDGGGYGAYGGGNGGGYGAGDGGYGQQPPYGSQPQGNSVMAIIALVTGILGVIPCFWGCFVFSIAALVLGILGKKEVQQGTKTGGGMAQAGFILGIIGIVLSIGYWVAFSLGAFDFAFYSDL